MTALLTTVCLGGLADPLDQWTRRSSPTTDTIWDVAWGNGRFAAAAGSILTSTDGRLWDCVNLSSDICFLGMSYVNGFFVASGLDEARGETAFAYSRDGFFSNTIVRNYDDLRRIVPVSVAYGNGIYVAVGDNADGERCGIMSSPDPVVNWTFRHFTRGSLDDIAFGNGKFVTAGACSLASTDGINWTGTTGYLSRVTFDGEAFTGIRLISSSPSYHAAIRTSANGVEWTVTQPDLPAYLHDLTFGNGQFVAVGYQGTIFTSADRTNWTARTSGTTNYLFAVTYGNGTFVAVGEDGTILQSGSFAPARLTTKASPDSRGQALTLSGEIGRSYRLQATPSLPATHWSNVLTVTLARVSTNLVDATATNFPRRFYRAVSP